MMQNGVSHRCACVTLSAKGEVSHHFGGVLTSLKKYRAIWGIAAIVSQYRAIRPHPQYGWDFPEEIPEKFRKDPGSALRAFPGIPLESTAGIPRRL